MDLGGFGEREKGWKRVNYFITVPAYIFLRKEKKKQYEWILQDLYLLGDGIEWKKFGEGRDGEGRGRGEGWK